MSSIGQIVANLRRERNLRSKYVAITAGIECSRYSRIENGQYDPSDEELVAMAAVLEVDYDDIVEMWQHNLASISLKDGTLIQNNR